LVATQAAVVGDNLGLHELSLEEIILATLGVILEVLVRSNFEDILEGLVSIEDIVVTNERNSLGEGLENFHPLVKRFV
jgi:hypothetical protein